MANPKVIRIKRSAVPGKIPQTTDLVLGELALNTYDGRLYTTINTGVASVVQLGADRFTGDVTGSGNGSVALTLANTAVIAGSYGSTTSVGTFTVDSKGRLTAASNVAIAFPVISVAGKTGAVALAVADVSGAAPLASPALTGTPTAPTATTGTNTTQIATTAFVTSAIAAIPVGVTSFNTRTGAITLTSSDVTTALGFTPVNSSTVGAASGVATLDSSGKLTSSQIPSSLVGAVVYQGVWNAATNTPTLTSGTGTKGNYYKVSVAGTTTIDGNSQWNIGDMIIFNGSTWDKIDGISSEVTSVAGRVGAVVLAVADVSGAAPLASPALTGTPTAPTAAISTNTTQLATTAFVLGQASSTTPSMDGSAAVGVATTFARADHVHPTDTTRAPLASPALTGTPTAPTAPVGTNTTQVATTAFVTAAINAIPSSGVTSFNTRTGAVTLSSADVTTALGYTPYNATNPSGYATLASPVFTGAPTAPTAAVDTNTTQLATTAYVIGQGYLKSSVAATTYAPIASPSFTGTITSAGNLTSVDNSQRLNNFSVFPAGYLENAPINFRFDQDVLRHIGRKTGTVLTLNGFVASDVDILFSQYSSYVNLANKPDGSQIQITGFSYNNTQNTAWYPYLFMHASYALSRVVMEIQTDNATTTGWQVLYDGAVTGYKIANVSCAGGSIIGARWTFYGQGSNNIYIRSLGVIGKNSDGYAWTIMKGGDTMYGDLNFGGTYTAKIQGNAVWHAGNLTNLNQLTNGPGYATLASPTFTGTPVAPTAAINTNTTQLATTAFVLGQASTTAPIMDSTAAVGTATTFARADHVHPTDTTRAPTASPTFTGVATAQNIAITAGIGNSISFWGNNTTYRIAMGNTAEYQYGTITDYAIKFFMGGATGRGVVFGQDGQTPVAAINTITGDAKFAGTLTANNFSGISSSNVTTALGYTPLQASTQSQSFGDYPVPTATYVPITLPNAVTTLTAGYAYRITLTTYNTGTNTGAVYNVYQSAATTWNAVQVTASGNTSNYPLLRVNVAGTGLEVYHNHPATYTIRAAVKMWATGNSTIIDPAWFGLEGVITAPLGVAKVGNNTIWHAGNLTNLNQLTNGPGYITSSGTAANVTGTVAIANGGTGATTASSALTNLGAAALTGASFTGAISSTVNITTVGTTLTSPGFWQNGTVNAAAGTCYGMLSRGTLKAAVANDKLYAIAADSVSVDTSNVAVATFAAVDADGATASKVGTGVITNAFGLFASAPTIGTNNYAGYFSGLTYVSGSLTVTGTITGSLSGNATTATTAGNVTGTVAIANGGTGSTTASAARTALGAAASGSNGDITTLTGLTTAFSLPSGSTAPSLLGSANNAVVAAGTTQSTATVLTADINVVTSGTGGVSLPSAIAGRCATVVNKTVSTITVYPATGHGIDGNGTNAGISLPANGFIEVYASAAGQWYSTTNAIINSSYVIGNISGNAANVTGTVAIANGGTGATTAAAAIANLGAASASAPIFSGDITHGSSTNYGAAAAPVYKQLGYSTSDQGRLILNHSAASYSTIGVNGTGGIWIGTTSSADGLSGVVKYLSFDNTGNATFKNPIAVSSGGTGVATLTGLAYGNGTGAFTAATGAQIASALGTTGISGNAATASRLTDQSVGIRLANPGGASYSTQTTSVTGAFKIRLPTTAFKSNTMLQFTVKIYEYNGSRCRTILIGGYNYSDAAANWNQISVSQITTGGGDINVRFGNDGAAQCVWIGDTSTVWSYPQVTVIDFQGGYSSTTDAIWGTGWSITAVTAFDTVTQGPTLACAPLHSGNYTNYAPSVSGTGATGTWNISIAGTAATASALSGFTNSNSSTPVTSADNLTQNGHAYVQGMSLLGQTDGALYAQGYNASYVHQIYGDYRTGQIALRGKNNGTWQPWRIVLDASNYNSYAPTLSGVGATGTWPITVTGNASNVTGIVAVANGGTGATSAAAARTNLGAAASGANSDITTLTGLTTAFTLPAASTAAGLLGSANNSVAASGTTQATATALTADTNVVTSGTGGVVLPNAIAGKYAVVVNKTSAAINVYPANAHVIDGNAANAAISLPVGGFIEVYGSASGQWYSTNNAIINGSYVIGNISGNAATATLATSANKCLVLDSRSTVFTPSSLGMGGRFDFMANSTDGLSDGGTYHGVLSIQQWTDGSGGGTRQLAFTDNDNMWLRGSGGSQTAWGSWKKIWNSANLTNVSQLTNDSGYITSSGTATNVSGTVAIANGGTGATSAAAALTNLGAVAKAGDTMTGTLVLSNSNPVITLKDNAHTGAAQLGYINFYDSTNTQRAYIGYGSSSNTTFYINNGQGPVSIDTSSNVLVTNTTATTSPTSGALVVSGGLGVAGDTNVGGVVTAQAIIITDASGVGKYKIAYNPTTDSLETIKL